MAGTASTMEKKPSETVALFMAGNNSSGKYLLSISYEKRDSVPIKQHVASHTSTILIQHNLNLNGLFPADIILEINKTSLLSKSGECSKEEGGGNLHILAAIPLQITLISGWRGEEKTIKM